MCLHLQKFVAFFFFLFSRQVLNDVSGNRAPPDCGDGSLLLQHLNGASPGQFLKKCQDKENVASVTSHFCNLKGKQCLYRNIVGPDFALERNTI